MPDLLANGGGVAVSYYEWAQDIQREAWTDEQVVERLRGQMKDAVARVLAAAERWGVDWRTAAQAVGIEPVAEASSAGGDRDPAAEAGAEPRRVEVPSRERNGPVEWDARTYHKVAAPQEEWGREVLARLELRGDETVLDAGCGSGRVTRADLRAPARGPGDRRRRLAVR